MLSTEYDREADALYLRLRAGMACRTQEVDPGTLVDLDEHGELLGIEVIRPSRAWPLEEVLSRYHVAADDALMLRSLDPWRWQEPLHQGVGGSGRLALA